jgi:hypothetical protein
LEGLGTVNVGVFYCHLVYFTAIWYILLPFGTFYGSSVSSAIIRLRKIWQPCLQEREELRLRVTRTEIAILNAVGPNASRYFRNLQKFLNTIPNNIMGLPWFQGSIL